MAAKFDAEVVNPPRTSGDCHRSTRRRLLGNIRHPLPLVVAVAIIAALVWVRAPGQISRADTPTLHVASSETTITIAQLQIQFTVPSDLSDLTWTVYGQQEARFSTKKLEAMDPDCNSINSPLGYVRIGGPNDQHGILEQLIATFAHSYLYYFTPQGPCSADQTAEDLQGQLFPELKDALKTAVQTVSPTPDGFPASGGPPAGENAPWVLMAGGLAAFIGIVCMAFAVRKNEDQYGR